ncbi:hypothetical protein ABEX25_25255 [Paenibacillus thiaminolyticus]|uniref:hypothetical protein n=1 Tax=Paenibacillus thiaminolyticus TaxID=49283 RepID=UPI003D2C42C2
MTDGGSIGLYTIGVNGRLLLYDFKSPINSLALSNAPAIFEQLSKITPTVVFPYHTFGDTRDEIRTFGEMLGKEKEAEWAGSTKKSLYIPSAYGAGYRRSISIWS